MTEHLLNENPDPTYFTWAVLGYGHPDDVLTDAELTSDEKRMILASWLSDRRAVENEPGLRQVDSGAIVSIDEIMDALQRLDAPAPTFDGVWKVVRRKPRRRAAQRYHFPNSDDEDDPPPCASAALPPRPPRDDPEAAGILIPDAIAA